MEPRPQRPRAQAGQPTRSTGPSQPGHPNQAVPPGEYPEGFDPTSFITPPRTEYDYSPLDLAPPGQRRRRQLVAAAVGALGVLLLGSVVFFSYLLLRDEDAPSQNDDLLAAQTQIANEAATVSANQTVIAQAAAEQTAQAQALNPETTTEATTGTGASTDAQTSPASDAPPAGDGTSQGETPPAESAATESAAQGNAPDLSGNAGLPAEELTALLPAPDQVPDTLVAGEDTSRTQEEVVAALGGGRPAETNIADWGWSGNVERLFTAADPETVDPASTTVVTVSIHGFGNPEAAAEALPFFSDILVNSLGYSEIEDPGLAGLGDSARLLTQSSDEGQNVALYIQDGSVMYRLGGFSATGDPAADIVAIATEMLGG